MLNIILHKIRYNTAGNKFILTCFGPTDFILVKSYSQFVPLQLQLTFMQFIEVRLELELGKHLYLSLVQSTLYKYTLYDMSIHFSPAASGSIDLCVYQIAIAQNITNK
jgi:hypothetical protein